MDLRSVSTADKNGGNALATLAGQGGQTQLVTVLPKAFEKAQANAGKTAEVVNVAAGDAGAKARCQIKEFVEDPGQLLLAG